MNIPTKLRCPLAALLLLTPTLLPAQVTTSELPLMPWPSSISIQPGAVPIDYHFTVAASGPGASDPRVVAAVASVYARVARQTGLPILIPQTEVTNPTLAITVASAGHPFPQRLGDNEKYTLTAAGSRITLNAEEPIGVLRGIETFLQLIEQNEGSGNPADAGFSVHCVSIQDEPRFPWRGLSFDVSRHFMPIPVVKRTIDGLAAVKLNVLHWHLSDDQGFRVESKKYPKLHELGSDGLFYTQDEVRDVIHYAYLHGVRVVPEFDTPGHSSSWLPGYPELASGPGPYDIVREGGILTAVIDPTKETTYEFLDGFIGEMADLFPDEYFHIGGDEVDPTQWKRSASIRAFMDAHHLADTAALHTYFNQRLLKIVTAHGKHMEGWDEIFQPNLPKSTIIQSWRGQQSLWKAAREGYQGILSAGYYLDLMYSASDHYAADPLKVPPHSRDAKPGSPADLTPEQAKLILGGEGAMWVELATAENIDSKLWPRLAAIAERLWSPADVTDVQSMYQRLADTSRWLEWLGLTHRSNLELMRKRLVGDAPVGPLDTFSSVLESVKGYKRHEHHYTSYSAFNRLIDSIPPESEAARRFNLAVDNYLAAPKNTRSSQDLRYRLNEWATACRQVRPIMQANSLLAEDVPVADGVLALSQAGLGALDALDGVKPAPTGFKANQSAVVAKYNNKAVGVFLIQIAPGVHKLIDALP